MPLVKGRLYAPRDRGLTFSIRRLVAVGLLRSEVSDSAVFFVTISARHPAHGLDRATVTATVSRDGRSLYLYPTPRWLKKPRYRASMEYNVVRIEAPTDAELGAMRIRSRPRPRQEPRRQPVATAVA